MKFLVTGATGLLGNNLVRFLLESNHSVRILCRQPIDRPELVGLDVEIVKGDVTDSNACSNAAEGVDCIVHCAGLIHMGWRRVEESRAINVNGAVNMAEAALKHTSRYIQISTVDALAPGAKNQAANESDMEPSKVASAYVVSKREADAKVLDLVDRGLDVVILYPGLMFGAYDWKPSSGQMIAAIANGFVPFAPLGGITVLDVEDACRGIVAAAENAAGGERFILGGHNLTYLELWTLIANRLDRPKPWGRLGPVNAWIAGKFGDLKSSLFGNEGPINSASVAMSNYFNYYSSNKAEIELGYSINPLEPAIDRAIEFLKTENLM